MIFEENKYTKIYNQLINKRKIEKLSKEQVYCETHHILPRSLGGDDSDSNLVNLLPREHFIAHLLLTKMVTKEDDIIKMNWALHKMCYSGIDYFNSRDYDWYRKRHIEFLKAHHPSKKPSWRKAVSERVLSDWEHNFERRKKTSDKMRAMWREGKIQARDQTGEKNHMWGKNSWNKGKKYSNDKVKGQNNGASIAVTLQNDNGDIYSFPTLKEACQTLNLDYACMLQVSRGKNKQHKGYKIVSKSNNH